MFVFKWCCLLRWTKHQVPLSWVLSKYKFFSFVPIWFLQVLLQLNFFRFVTIWVLNFCHKLSFWVLAQFELSFAKIWFFFSFVRLELFVFVTIPNIFKKILVWQKQMKKKVVKKSFSFVPIWFCKFCYNCIFLDLSQFGFLIFFTNWGLEFWHNLS